jgi:YjbE family integral membrane protein
MDVSTVSTGMLYAPAFWLALMQIIVINIMLSGDNAVVIALASRSLPPLQQKRAIMFGSLGAIVLRIVLTFFAMLLLDLPYLKLLGGLALLWIGASMLVDDAEEDLDAHAHLWAAIRVIIVADFIMSLDNVLGVAAAAKSNIVLLVLGLGISIPLIIWGSQIILRMMERFPMIVTLGAALLGWVAGEMLVGDKVVSGWIEANAPALHLVLPAACAVLVVVAGKWMASRAASSLERKPTPQPAKAS